VGQLAERIYLVGGAGMREAVSSVECWDGTVWRPVARLNKAREGPGVVGYGGKLYAIGKHTKHSSIFFVNERNICSPFLVESKANANHSRKTPQNYA
jgi:hypothetical protein